MQLVFHKTNFFQYVFLTKETELKEKILHLYKKKKEKKKVCLKQPTE